MVETLDRELVTKTWTIKYADVEAVAENIESVDPERDGDASRSMKTAPVDRHGDTDRIQEVEKL